MVELLPLKVRQCRSPPFRPGFWARVCDTSERCIPSVAVAMILSKIVVSIVAQLQCRMLPFRSGDRDHGKRVWT